MMKNADVETTDNRAVSVTTGYIINIGVATLAVSLIMFSLQGLFTDIRDDAQETELRVVGERVVWELEKTDRMARLSEDDVEGTVYFESDRTENRYRINVTEDEVRLSGGGATEVTLEHDVEAEMDDEALTELAGGQEHVIEYEKDEITEIR